MVSELGCQRAKPMAERVKGEAEPLPSFVFSPQKLVKHRPFLRQRLRLWKIRTEKICCSLSLTHPTSITLMRHA